MIKENELRIGNLTKEGEIIQIRGNKVIVKNKLNSFYLFINDITPVLLTEEILLKFEDVVKHKSMPNRYVLKDSDIQLSIEDGYWNEPSLDIIVNGTYITCVEFVHQFQNVIFTLINQELNIEL